MKLNGWKTYLIVALGVILNGLASQGIIPAEAIDIANKILVFAGLGTIRHSIKTGA